MQSEREVIILNVIVRVGYVKNECNKCWTEKKNNIGKTDVCFSYLNAGFGTVSIVMSGLHMSLLNTAWLT